MMEYAEEMIKDMMEKRVMVIRGYVWEKGQARKRKWNNINYGS